MRGRGVGVTVRQRDGEIEGRREYGGMGVRECCQGALVRSRFKTLPVCGIAH